METNVTKTLLCNNCVLILYMCQVQENSLSELNCLVVFWISLQWPSPRESVISNLTYSTRASASHQMAHMSRARCLCFWSLQQTLWIKTLHTLIWYISVSDSVDLWILRSQCLTRDTASLAALQVWGYACALASVIALWNSEIPPYLQGSNSVG